jgi:hypothetical protein
MANIFVAATATWNGKALTKGQKQLTSFEKSVKSLGRTLGVSLGAAALINYGKKAVTAFTNDEKAAKSLEQQLKNTGYAFSAPDVEYYIANLQKMTGVLDDQLRPAFQTLLTASGSLTKSQQALALALDISAATGKSVEEVSMALAKGFSGQTTALSRLGAGIDKATLATGDMDKIMGELQNKFSGQAKARLETYAGKMDQLKVASANASEAIGKGILNALSAIGKDKNLGTVTTNMENLGIQIGNVIAGLGVMIGKFTSIAQNSGFLKLLAFSISTSPIALLAKLGASASKDINAPSSNFTYSLGANAGVELAKIQELKARKALVVTLKAEADLKKLQDKYNVERIGLMAALNAATDDETKQRLAEKLAILDGNAALAQKYLADRAAADSALNFADKANEASTAIGKTASALTNTLLPALFTAAGEMTARAGRVLPSLADTNTSITTGSSGSTSVNTTVTVNPPDGGTGANPSAQDIEDTVQNALLSLYRQGRNVVPAGSL